MNLGAFPRGIFKFKVSGRKSYLIGGCYRFVSICEALVLFCSSQEILLLSAAIFCSTSEDGVGLRVHKCLTVD